MGRASKDKGASFERCIAAAFTTAFYPDGEGVFRRVPLSGGWDKRLTPGDLMALKKRSSDSEELVLDSSFPFSVEAKCWNSKSISHFLSGLYGEESAFFLWMKQSESDVSNGSKIPIVVFKIFRKPVICIRKNDFLKMQEVFGSCQGTIYELRKGSRTESSFSDNLVFFLLEEFFIWVDWSIYRFVDSSRLIRSLVKKGEADEGSRDK